MSVSKSRLLATMDIIPTYPETITVKEIREALNERGFKPGDVGSNVRTIQRDLNHIKSAPLSRQLESTETPGRVFHWYWKT